MNSICKTLIAGVLLLSFFNEKLQAQYKTSGYDVGLNLGTLVYQGDLSKGYLGNYRSLQPALGLSVSKTFDPYFSLRANFTIGKISADESKYSSPAWRQSRGFSFSSSVKELSSVLVFNLYGENNEYNNRRLLPYIFGGAGVTFLNIKRDWSKLNTTFYDSKSKVQLGLAIDTVHSLPTIIPVLPVGAGIRYPISSQLSFNTELTYRFTTTDYLDGFKYSANENKRDAYYGLSFGLRYRFGNYKCPSAGK